MTSARKEVLQHAPACFRRLGLLGSLYGSPLIAAARHGYKYKLSLPVGGGADPHRKIEEGVYGYPIIAAAANRNFDCEGLIEFF
jgi:hypothetical protein